MSLCRGAPRLPMTTSRASVDTPIATASGATLDRQLMLAKLKGHGLRVTSPRVTLLDVLCGMSQPATIAQLFARTEKAGQATCDLVTIYRTMAAFEKAGVVYRSGFSERGAVLYSTHVGGSRRYPLVQRGTSVVEE